MNDRLRYLIFGLYVFFGLGYGLLVPLWEASDEPAHYRLALALAREHRFPSLAQNHEAAQPRLYYWLASGPLALLDAWEPTYADAYNARVKPSLRDEKEGGTAWQKLARHEAFDGQSVFLWNDENYRFVPGPMLLRGLNLLLGALTLELCFRAVRRALPQAPAVALASVALIALTPQFLHVSASVSNDPLANLAGGLLFLLLCRTAVEPASPRLAAATVVLSMSLPFLTKLTVLPIALAALTASLWSIARFARTASPRSAAVALAGVGTFGAVLLVALGAAQSPLQSVWLRAIHVQPEALSLGPEIFTSFARSYWSAVGWMSVEMPGRAWVALTLVGAIGIAGTLRLLGRRAADAADPRAALGSPAFWGWIWLALALTLVIAGKNALASLQAQGRYLFPSIGALALAMTAGWCALWPRLMRGDVVYAVLGLLIAANLWMWLAGLLPAYYQPFLD